MSSNGPGNGRNNEATMDRTLSNEVRAAVSEALKDLNLADLKQCHEELMATREALLDMQQNFLVWQELARMRGDENERLKASIEQMQTELTKLRTEIVLLRSSLESIEASHERSH